MELASLPRRGRSRRLSAHPCGLGRMVTELLGVRGILVDALDDDAKRFYEQFGFRASAALPLKLMVTLPEIDRVLGAAS